MDLANRCDFYFLPECLVKYRLHGGNSVSRDAAGWLHDYALHGQYLLERYGDQIPRKWKATLMYRTGCDIHGRGDRHGGRKWMLKAIAAHPFKSEYYAGLLSSFCRREIMPRSLQRKAPSD
jgi:hypothetical protein